MTVVNLLVITFMASKTISYLSFMTTLIHFCLLGSEQNKNKVVVNLNCIHNHIIILAKFHRAPYAENTAQQSQLCLVSWPSCFSAPDSSSGGCVILMWVRIPVVTLVSLSKMLFSSRRGYERVPVGVYPHSNRGPITKGTMGQRLLSQRKSLWSMVATTKSWTKEGPGLQVCTFLCECTGWYCVWKSLWSAFSSLGLYIPQGAEKD